MMSRDNGLLFSDHPVLFCIIYQFGYLLFSF